MRTVIGMLCFLLVSVCGCSQYRTESPSGAPRQDRITAWPRDWSEHLGQTVTLDGTAADAKLGALLKKVDREDAAIWIDGLERWPNGFYREGGKGKRLRVTGTVIKRDDLPVFVQRPGEVSKGGIPVQSGEELEKAKWRYLLKDVKWTVLE